MANPYSSVLQSVANEAYFLQNRWHDDNYQAVHLIAPKYNPQLVDEFIGRYHQYQLIQFTTEDGATYYAAFHIYLDGHFPGDILAFHPHFGDGYDTTVVRRRQDVYLANLPE